MNALKADDRGAPPVIRWHRYLRLYAPQWKDGEAIRMAGERIISRHWGWWDNEGMMADLLVEAREAVATAQV